MAEETTNAPQTPAPQQTATNEPPKKVCPKCQSLIPKFAETCPQCGANLKPFYKKAWFWVLIVVLLLFLGLGGCTAACSSSADKALNGPSVTSTGSNTAAQSSSSAEKTDYSALSVGSAVNLEDGLSVTVNSVEGGLTQSFSDKLYTRVTVTYVNNGKKDADFNVYDWKAQDASGAARTQGFYTDGNNDLSSGQLTAGGTVTGDIYFEGDITKVLYYHSLISDSATAGWVVA